ncbi:MAG: hypothetical protein HOQ29_14930 [Acidobacteria bacterium]|nr:hypothetical protein [Acidobacteriota bacterium]
MTKAVWGARIGLLGALACAGLASGCGNLTRQGTASSYLVLTSLQGASGGSGTFSSVLASDVLNVNPTTGAQSIAADLGQAVFQLALKDPGPSGSPNAPSPNNAITITQYHVQYVRSDGRNVQGVDVPYAFDGGVNLTVAGTGTVAFTLVRVQAKQEAPLKALAFGGGADSITTVAKVTFYGHDQTGRDVSVTGNIEVTFSDWAG